MGEERKEEDQEMRKEDGKKEDVGQGKDQEGEKKEEEEEEKPVGEVIVKVEMHCEGCARKVNRSLRGFPGVEDVQTDSKSHRVVVKGKDLDPVKICERIERKSGKKVEIISPLPKPPAAAAEEEKKEEPTQEEKKEEPVVVTVVLSVRMHCESCAQVVQRRIQKMKGVESVETDFTDDKVIVKGVVDPATVVEYIYKQTRKVATIVPPPPPPPEEEKKEEEKKDEKSEGEKKEGDEGNGGEEDLKSEIKRIEYWPTRYYITEYAYLPPPQIFSDENPNACCVM